MTRVMHDGEAIHVPAWVTDLELRLNRGRYAAVRTQVENQGGKTGDPAKGHDNRQRRTVRAAIGAHIPCRQRDSLQQDAHPNQCRGVKNKSPGGMDAHLELGKPRRADQEKGQDQDVDQGIGGDQAEIGTMREEFRQAR